MGSLTFGTRLLALAAFVFLIVGLVTAGFVGLGIIGVGMAASSSLALAILFGLLLFVAVAMAFVLGPGALTLFLISLVLFGIALLAGLGAIPALLVVVAFLLIVVLILAVLSGIALAALAGLATILLLLPLVLLAAGALSAGIALIAIAVLGLAAVAAFVLWLVFGMSRVPLPLLGLGGLTSMPALPVRLVPDVPVAVLNLLSKQARVDEVEASLTNVFTLGTGASQKTATAHEFLYGTAVDRSRALDDPTQFAMGWPTIDGLDRRAAPLAATFAAALTDPAAASAQFWPLFSSFYAAFGPLPLAKVTQGDADGTYKPLMGADWTPAMDAMVTAGTLFVIDLRLFEAPTVTAPSVARGRFTPSTVTFLTRSVVNFRPVLTPFLVRVSNGTDVQVYRPGAAGTVAGSTWLYALAAARTSLTCWGIWLGHVYRTHIVTAAMQMTMYQQLQGLHPVRQLLGRQANYLIGFDVVLLGNWSFPPPTSAVTAIDYLKLTDTFAVGRTFFGDDPDAALRAGGVTAAEFSTPLVSASEIVNQAALVGRLRNAADLPAQTLAPLLVNVPLNNPAVTNEQQLALLVADLNALIQAGGATLANAFALLGLFTGPTAARRDGVRDGSITDPATVATINREMLDELLAGQLVPMAFNAYPVARYLLWLQRITRDYVTAVVNAYYPDDPSVGLDADLGRWIVDSGNPLIGNVRGLSALTTKAALVRVVTSLIYRITAHGIARLTPIGVPALAFLGNFPPCLEDARLPDADDPNGDGTATPSVLTTRQLLEFLPRTGTIGEMLSFIYGFVYTEPYEPFIPRPGSNTAGLVPDPEVSPFLPRTPLDAAGAANAALATVRNELRAFIAFFLADQNGFYQPTAQMNFQPTLEQVHNWELNIET